MAGTLKGGYRGCQYSQKKKIVGVSTFLTMLNIVSFLRISSSLSRCMISETSHSTPSPKIIPTHGGRCVNALNTGTKSSMETPRKRMKVRSNGVVISSEPCILAGRFTSPLTINDIIANGTTHADQARKDYLDDNVYCGNLSAYPEHNGCDVANGDHAPPELKVITIMLAKSQRVGLSEISFLSRATITIVVVRLSRTADMKKVMNPMIQISFYRSCNPVGDDGKSLVLVNYLHYSHGAKKEEKNFGNAYKVLAKFALKGKRWNLLPVLPFRGTVRWQTGQLSLQGQCCSESADP